MVWTIEGIRLWMATEGLGSVQMRMFSREKVIFVFDQRMTTSRAAKSTSNNDAQPLTLIQPSKMLIGSLLIAMYAPPFCVPLTSGIKGPMCLNCANQPQMVLNVLLETTRAVTDPQLGGVLSVRS